MVRDQILSALITWRMLWVGLLWFFVGAALSWNRGLRPAVYAPLFVAVVPAFVATMSAGARFGLPGTAAAVGAAVPFVASLLGGHASEVVAPQRRSARKTRLAVERAYKRAAEAEADVLLLQAEIERMGSALQTVQEPQDVRRLDQAADILRVRVEAGRRRLRDAAELVGGLEGRRPA